MESKNQGNNTRNISANVTPNKDIVVDYEAVDDADDLEKRTLARQRETEKKAKEEERINVGAFQNSTCFEGK